MFVTGIAGILFLWFLGALRARLVQEEKGAGRLSAGPQALLIHQMRLTSYSVTWFALGPMLVAVAALSFRTGAFPRWHANAAYVLFFAGIAVGLGTIADGGAFAPGARSTTRCSSSS